MTEKMLYWMCAMKFVCEQIETEGTWIKNDLQATATFFVVYSLLLNQALSLKEISI